MVRGPILVATAVVSASAMKCPGSKAWLGHAKTEVTATANAPCAQVQAEITMRGQESSEHTQWTDPHNGGIYTVLSNTPATATPIQIETQRTTNPKHAVGGMTYTDKQTFTLTDADGKCTIEACSESQGSSLKDFSTNYCDIRNLYCGTADGCKLSNNDHDFTTTETKVDASSGQHDFSACIVKATAVAKVEAAPGQKECAACLARQAKGENISCVKECSKATAVAKVEAAPGQKECAACKARQAKGENISCVKECSKAAETVAAALPTCPPKDFTSVQNFDLTAFVKTRWYIQQQMPVTYLPKTENRCIYAEYTVLKPKSILGYDIQVHNYAQDTAAPHAVHDSKKLICAAIVDAATGKLEVAPCFLPKAASGDYWVIAFDDAEGWALISGGPPTHAAAGGCQTGTGINGSGLWIFTRAQTRDDSIVDKVRGVAKAKGFDLSVLNDVDQTGCKYESATTVVV